MSKSKTLELIAKTLFLYNNTFFSNEEIEAAWKNLPHERDLQRMYSLCKKEYFRMAKGVYEHVIKPLQTNIDI